MQRINGYTKTDQIKEAVVNRNSMCSSGAQEIIYTEHDL